VGSGLSLLLPVRLAHRMRHRQALRLAQRMRRRRGAAAQGPTLALPPSSKPGEGGARASWAGARRSRRAHGGRRSGPSPAGACTRSSSRGGPPHPDPSRGGVVAHAGAQAAPPPLGSTSSAGNAAPPEHWQTARPTLGAGGPGSDCSGSTGTAAAAATKHGAAPGTWSRWDAAASGAAASARSQAASAASQAASAASSRLAPLPPPLAPGPWQQRREQPE